MRLRSFLAALLLLLTLPGCVAIYRGRSHDIAITSSPSGARFQFGECSGTTPATITVDRSWHRKTFECALTGYAPASMDIDPEDLGIGDDPLLAIVAFCSGLLILPGLVDIIDANGCDYPHRIHVGFAGQGSGGMSMVSVTRLSELRQQRAFLNAAPDLFVQDSLLYGRSVDRDAGLSSASIRSP